MKIRTLDQREIAQMVAIAQGKELLRALDTPRDLWRAEHIEAAGAALKEAEYAPYYDYTTRTTIEVDTCWWEVNQDDSSSSYLVLIFSAPYVGRVRKPHENHSVYYRVEDGELVWIDDQFA